MTEQDFQTKLIKTYEAQGWSIEPRIYKLVKDKQDYTVSHYRHDKGQQPVWG